MACEEKIKELLEIYHEGKTSLEEEQELRDFFNSDREIPRDLLYARVMFTVFTEAASAKIPGTSRAVTVNNLSVIPQPDTFVTTGKTEEERVNGKYLVSQPRSPKTDTGKRKVGFRHSIGSRIGIAAAIAVLVAMTGITLTKVQPQREVVYCYVNGEPVTDYKTACGYIEDMGSLLSYTINQPTEYFAPIKELSNTLDVLSHMEELLNSLAPKPESYKPYTTYN